MGYRPSNALHLGDNQIRRFQPTGPAGRGLDLKVPYGNDKTLLLGPYTSLLLGPYKPLLLGPWTIQTPPTGYAVTELGSY